MNDKYNYRLSSSVVAMIYDASAAAAAIWKAVAVQSFVQFQHLDIWSFDHLPSSDGVTNEKRRNRGLRSWLELYIVD